MSVFVGHCKKNTGTLEQPAVMEEVPNDTVSIIYYNSYYLNNNNSYYFVIIMCSNVEFQEDY